MKRKKILAAVIALVFAGFVLWRVTAFPRLRTEEKSYPISTRSVAFILETGARPISYGLMGDYWLQYDTPIGWREVPLAPDWEEPNYFALGYEVLPFSSHQIMTIGLEQWNIAATGPGAYRLVFLCEKKSLFDHRWGEDILLTSQPFQLQ